MEEEDYFGLYWRHFDMTREEWIGWCLLSFHLTHFLLLWLCWRHENAQMITFTCLGGLMLAAERLNELLAQQQWLSRQNYFDSSGMFFSIVVGGPVILHLLILLFAFLKRSFDTMVIVKRAQIIQKQKSEAQKKTD